MVYWPSLFVLLKKKQGKRARRNNRDGVLIYTCVESLCTNVIAVTALNNVFIIVTTATPASIHIRTVCWIGLFYLTTITVLADNILWCTVVVLNNQFGFKINFHSLSCRKLIKLVDILKVHILSLLMLFKQGKGLIVIFL